MICKVTSVACFRRFGCKRVGLVESMGWAWVPQPFDFTECMKSRFQWVLMVITNFCVCNRPSGSLMYLIATLQEIYFLMLCSLLRPVRRHSRPRLTLRRRSRHTLRIESSLRGWVYPSSKKNPSVLFSCCKRLLVSRNIAMMILSSSACVLHQCWNCSCDHTKILCLSFSAGSYVSRVPQLNAW